MCTIIVPIYVINSYLIEFICLKFRLMDNNLISCHYNKALKRTNMIDFTSFFDYILHIDSYLNSFVSNYGFWTYLALFLVIFCETGLIVTPFLPGDSLLFAAGTIAAQPGHPLNIFILFLLLFFASCIGNQVNFLIGKAVGSRIFTAKRSWMFNKKHLA